MFGTFRLFPARQLLLENEAPVRLGSRALEILSALVERPGEMVSKDELTTRVWPDTIVEESNLKVHVAALRRALGEGQYGRRYIATVPGRGYRFVAPVEDANSAEPLACRSDALEPAHNLQASLTRMIGRSDTVGALPRQLTRHRLVTVAGPGGIGKTMVAIAAAEALIGSYRHGVRFVDLASLGDPRSVPCAVASAVGLTTRSENTSAVLMDYLRNKEILIVLDGCEHVIEGAASLAEQMICSAPNVHILVTSREALRLRGERMQHLSPLASPPSSSVLTAAEALTFPAVELFAERAAESLAGFALSDADAPLVAGICRKLEGIPLALELAATRIDAFGVRALSTLLDDKFRLLQQERRTAVSRHRTLAAVLDWSYAFLPEAESTILRRLSLFAGAFTIEAAGAVSAAAGMSFSEVIDGIENLVKKSLLSADVSGPVAEYRLLDTTRAYLLQKLAESGELETMKNSRPIGGIERSCATLDRGGRMPKQDLPCSASEIKRGWAAGRNTGQVIAGRHADVPLGAGSSFPMWIIPNGRHDARSRF
jgi:predicted ATPase/DNA-binding winged helix-turn-helix (wHTH) protein